VSSPTRRSLEHLRKSGADLVAVVERWNPHAKIRQDLFGCVDVLAIHGETTIAVQATSGSNVASRVTKLTESPALPVMRAAGWRILVHGWRKAANGRWVLREVDCS
jgi:hypothetical protein